MADGASLYAFISISIRTHFVFQAEIKIIEAVPGRGSARCRPHCSLHLHESRTQPVLVVRSLISADAILQTWRMRGVI